MYQRKRIERGKAMWMRKSQTYTKFVVAIAVSICMFISPATVLADTYTAKSTGISKQIKAVGEYINWEGVSGVSQFLDKDGNYCFAYNTSKSVIVVKTKNGKPLKKTISLKKQYPLYGGVVCDSTGNYYLVSGKTNTSANHKANTVFISKYDSTGKPIKTVGDNGSSSLGYWYTEDFYTKTPFDGGNCDIAINGDYLAVNYARHMYSGHQSNSVFVININTMTKMKQGNIYNSHSFAQRTLPYSDGFVFASEGDCYNRAFTVSIVTDMSSGFSEDSDIFHFWVKKDTLKKWDMTTLNNNFAHMGGLVSAGDNTVALVGTSAKSLTSKAASENEQLFIQIFDPSKNLNQPSAYITSGNRSGYSGGNGDEKVTDYGVKWLTSYSGKYTISHPEVVADEKGDIVILYELKQSGKYKGVYYIVVDSEGKIVRKETKYSATAYLNPCETPVCSGNTIYWTGNNSKNKKMYIYSLQIS